MKEFFFCIFPYTVHEGNYKKLISTPLTVDIRFTDGFWSRFHGEVSTSNHCKCKPSQSLSFLLLYIYQNIIIFVSAVTVGVVETVCEWVVEGCEKLSQLWWRACSEGGGEEDHHRALRSLLLGAAARATHALTPLTAPNAAPAPTQGLISTAAAPSQPSQPGTDSKDPRMVAMMQQYTDILVNMVQQKMASHQPPPGPAWSVSALSQNSPNLR